MLKITHKLLFVHTEKIFVFFEQDIDGIPDELKALYKTVWEISQKVILEMAADRGAFIDQSQSLNVHIAQPNYGKLTSMHFYGWKLVSFIIFSCNFLYTKIIIFFAGFKNGLVLLKNETRCPTDSVHG